MGNSIETYLACFGCSGIAAIGANGHSIFFSQTHVCDPVSGLIVTSKHSHKINLSDMLSSFEASLTFLKLLQNLMRNHMYKNQEEPST